MFSSIPNLSSLDARTTSRAVKTTNVFRHRSTLSRGQSLPFVGIYYLAGGSKLLVSLGHDGRIRVILGHILTTRTLMKTDEQKKVLSKFMILFWASFIAILVHMRPTGHRLDALKGSEWSYVFPGYHLE